MKSVLVTSAMIALVAFLLAIGSAPLVFAVDASSAYGVASASPSRSVSPSLLLVPVTLTFSPITITLKHLSTCPTGFYWCGSNTLTIHNKGATSVKFTGCQFFFKKSTSATYTKGGCSFGGSTITVAGGASKSLTWITAAPFSNPAGTYNAKIIFTNSVDKSGTGKFNYIVP